MEYFDTFDVDGTWIGQAPRAEVHARGYWHRSAHVFLFDGDGRMLLQRRAADLTRLMTPFEPTEMLAALARHKAAHPDFPIERVHFFPLGGIGATADYAGRLRPERARVRA